MREIYKLVIVERESMMSYTTFISYMFILYQFCYVQIISKSSCMFLPSTVKSQGWGKFPTFHKKTKHSFDIEVVKFSTR